MKLMKIHYCLSCKYNRYFMEINPIRAKCCHPEAKTKKGQPRILNKRLMTLGHFPKWCPLEDYPRKISKAEMECHKRVFGWDKK